MIAKYNRYATANSAESAYVFATWDQGQIMTSEARIAANRQNARKSTGPQTVRGRVRSSMNAVTHGLTAKHFVAEGESLEEFQRLSQKVWLECSPKNELERHKVERLIELLWKLRRARRFETAILSTSVVNTIDFNIPLASSEEVCEQQYTENLPSRYQGGVTYSSLNGFFDLAEKVERYIERLWRQIYRVVDDLGASQLEVDYEETSDQKVRKLLG